MKISTFLFVLFFSINHCFSQVDYGSCQVITTGSPCFFGLYNFYISQVSLNSLNFGGGTCSGDGSDDGYQDLYATDSGTVSRDSTYLLTITRSGRSPECWILAWVDWNNDGDFVDTNELVMSPMYFSNLGGKTASVYVTVPADAKPGAHRFRTRTDGGDPTTSPNACALSGLYGDTKDFKLIVEGSICSVKIHTPYDNGFNCIYGCAATLWAEPTGAAPFSYLWSPVVSTDSVITNACVGTYSVTMTDHLGCITTDSVTINQPDSIRITAVITQPHYIKCDSLIPGSIHITSIQGGISPFDYLWSNGSTTLDIDNIGSAKYCFHVQDSNGCSADTCFTIMAPPPPPVLVLELTDQAPSCSGCSDGVITAHASGGLQPYTYSWSPSVSTDTIATGLGEGVYIVCVTDTLGCQICDIDTLVAPLLVYEHGNKGGFSISPNPAMNELRIIPLNLYNGRIKIEIYNVMGEALKTEELNYHKQITLDIITIPSGIYFLQIQTEDQRCIRRFVKE